MLKCPECGCTNVREVTWLDGSPGVQHIAEAELEQPLPAKEENAGSNPTSDTCAYCGKQNCEHKKLAREHLFNHRNIAL